MDSSADRWKTDGDCSKCRRQKYCSKRCRANKQAVTDLMTRAILDKTGAGEIIRYLSRTRR